MFSRGRLSSEVNTQYRGAPPSVLLTAKPIIAPDNLGKKGYITVQVRLAQ